MKVLVTGASGFIGHHLVDMLYSEGFEVKCLVRKTSKVQHLEGKAKLVYGEVTIPESLEEAVRGVDYVIHAAGVVKATSSKHYFDVNTTGTINLFNAVLNFNPNVKRFVFISSQAASRPSLEAISEETPPSPVTSYGKSKLMAEKFLEENLSNLPITIIRPSAVYGPHDKEFLPVYQMINTGIEILVKGGKTKISLVYVKDLSKSIILAMTSEKSVGKKYFSAHPEAVYLRDFYKVIEKTLGKNSVLKIPIPVPLLHTFALVNTIISKITKQPSMFNLEKVNEIKNSWVCSPERIINELGMKYEYSLERGMEETISWARESGLL